jgi:hypothetical protein
MKSTSLVCPMIAAAMFTATAQALETEAADKLNQERERIKVRANIDLLKYCVGGNPGCPVNGVTRLLLGLTRSEVETTMGPPHYQLHLAGKHVYYWTVSVNTNAVARNPRMVTIRMQVIYGDCYRREKNSRKTAVCEVRRY